MSYSIVVPVYNERILLEHTVPALLREIENKHVELTYVCNGCSDSSAEYLRGTVGERATIIELESPGKTAALNAGDRSVRLYPRFYLDADVIVSRGSLDRLAVVLKRGDIDLVAPKMCFDTSHSTKTAAKIMAVWESLPHGRQDGFHHLLGLSQRGRESWLELPPIMGDDAYIVARIPEARRIVVSDAAATTWAPRNFWSWVKTRARWERGHRELVRMKLNRPTTQFQRRELAKRVLHQGDVKGVFLYASCRMLASLLATCTPQPQDGWYHDRKKFEGDD